MNTRISYRNKPLPLRIIGAPQPTGILSFEDLQYEAWNVERPDHVVIAIGLNKRAALDDALIKLACAAHKIRMRVALPPAETLVSRHLA